MMKNLSSCLFFLLIFFCSASFAGVEVNEKLWDACITGNIDAFEEARASGADLDAKNNTRATGLMLACYHQRSNIIKRLLDYGIDVNAQDEFGYTALNFVIMNNDISDSKTIDLLIKHKIKTNTTDELLRTPFMLSCFNGWEHAVGKLLPDVNDINKKDSFGNTALALAYAYGYKEEQKKNICMLLLRNNADVNTIINSTRHGMTPILVLATKKKDEAFVAELLKIEGINTEAVDDEKKTALMWAQDSEDENIIKLFEEHKATKKKESKKKI